MVMIDELDSEDLKLLHDALIGKLAGYTHLAKTTEERIDVMLVGRLLRKIDRAMDVADEDQRAGIGSVNLDLFKGEAIGLRKPS